VKIYVAAVEALRNKERQDETQFTTKIALKVQGAVFWLLQGITLLYEVVEITPRFLWFYLKAPPGTQDAFHN
jgi:hypothetical protein